jgi:hypothetical protein
VNAKDRELYMLALSVLHEARMNGDCVSLAIASAVIEAIVRKNQLQDEGMVN